MRSTSRALVFLSLLLFPRLAVAYPFMVRHGYTSCAQCHADPSGGGVLTEYGRAQGEIVLRTPWGKRDEEWEPGRASKFAFGVVPQPDGVLLGLAVRRMHLVNEIDLPEGTPDQRIEDDITMQSDLRAHVATGKLRGYASIAFADEGAFGAALTKERQDNAASREHWIGWQLDDERLIRAGRIPIPFGLRIIEHTMFVREATRTDINDDQQHGIAAAYSGQGLRGEAMLILGNFQVKPDDFRERGIAAFIEKSIGTHHAVGLSTLATQSKLDVRDRVGLTRSATGAFFRTNPWGPLVLMGEADFLINVPKEADPLSGFAGLLSADLEPIQGLHLGLAAETLSPGGDAKPTHGGWVTLGWFFAPYVDARIDVVRRSLPGPGKRVTVTSFVYQMHFYL